MSQHNISGSEAFDRRPFVHVRRLKSGGIRRRRNRLAMAFLLGVLCALALVAVAAALILVP